MVLCDLSATSTGFCIAQRYTGKEKWKAVPVEKI